MKTLVLPDDILSRDGKAMAKSSNTIVKCDLHSPNHPVTIARKICQGIIKTLKLLIKSTRKLADSVARQDNSWHANKAGSEACAHKPQSDTVNALRVPAASMIFVNDVQTIVLQAFEAG